MSAARTLVTILYGVGFIVPSQGRIAKRIASGFPLWSQENYGTYHFIQLRFSWGCISNQALHELGGCQDEPYCAGTLFQPDFVITAAHCVARDEFYLRKVEDIYEVSEILGVDWPNRNDEVRLLGIFDDSVNTHVDDPRYNHAFYSNIALLAGSVDYFGMTQIRHSYKKFPHPNYSRGAVKKTSYFFHDVALIQVCQPFEITETVKVAPMVPLNDLKLQWESIIKRSTACLFVGFGRTEELRTAYKREGERNPLRTRYMRYTWRHAACSTSCQIAAWDGPKNPCTLCSRHIPPKLGSPRAGDSGSPIVCGGYYVGVHTNSNLDAKYNLSTTRGYPLFCIRRAIGPKRLDYYRQFPAGKDRKLGPVNRRSAIYSKYSLQHGPSQVLQVM